MPEFDREGSACSGSQGGKQDEAPTDKKSRLLEPPFSSRELTT